MEIGISVLRGTGGRRCIPFRLSLKRRAKMCALVCISRSLGGTVDSYPIYPLGISRKEALLLI